MRPPLLLLLCLAAAGLGAPRAWAGPPATYLVEAPGEIRDVRTFDVDGDGRQDVVVLLRGADGREWVQVMRTPATPVPRVLYPGDRVLRIPLGAVPPDVDRAGAVALGRFGPGGAPRLRFLLRTGVRDVDVSAGGAAGLDGPPHPPGTLLAGGPGRPIVFWDAVADLDGDGRDECWFPLAEGDGAIFVASGAGAAGDRVLDLTVRSRAASDARHALARHAYVPNLFAADLDGDGRKELLALRDGALLGWAPAAPDAAPATPLAPAFRLELPFLAEAAAAGPEELRTPRIQVEDVDGDGKADLLVTLITGVRSRLASIRTIFFHYPGPFRDPQTGGLVEPRSRLDTQSIVLHPTFVDLDGDGARDYVGDSIRGTMGDLVARMLGTNPKITLVGFRFDKASGTFARAPAFTLERPYSNQEALANRFGRSAHLVGDFDGDGHRDLLDVGDLEGVEILRGATQGVSTSFETPLLPRVPVKDGLRADARVADLDGDGRSDAVMWSATRLYIVLSGGTTR